MTTNFLHITLNKLKKLAKNLQRKMLILTISLQTTNNNMDIIIKELNKSLSGIDKSNEAINNIVIN